MADKTKIELPHVSCGEWRKQDRIPYVNCGDEGPVFGPIVFSGTEAEMQANAWLMAAALDLYRAAALLEVAEEAHANCPECDGEYVPELCPECFPLFDDARIARRNALEKAAGPRVERKGNE